MELRVLLVDDHIILREGLRALLEKDPELIVVGEAGNGAGVGSGAEGVVLPQRRESAGRRQAAGDDVRRGGGRDLQGD